MKRRKKKDNTRPTFPETFMAMAEVLAKRSSCERLQVGTLIVSSDFSQIYSCGFNGNAKGLKNKCDNRHKKGSCGCLHSEQNACIYYSSPRNLPKSIFCTHAPCKTCAKFILNLGAVRRVYYRNEYRDNSGIDLLRKAGILVVCLP